jgi:hypothetical protein
MFPWPVSSQATFIWFGLSICEDTVVVNLRAVGSVNLVTTDFNPLLIASHHSKSAIGTEHIGYRAN